MIIIETLRTRLSSPRYQPKPATAAIRIDTS